MDCHMPDVDGFQATAEWRRREGAGPRLPIVAMTAGVLATDRDRCTAAGMDGFVPKPIDVNLLEGTMLRWTDRAQEAGWPPTMTTRRSRPTARHSSAARLQPVPAAAELSRST